MTPPLFVILGGPNGAGKSSAATTLLAPPITFLNADDVARSLPLRADASRDYEAGRVVLNRLEVLSAERADLAIETTLASRSLAAKARELQRVGYLVRLVYVWSASPEFSIERVAARVRMGGHDIPIPTIRRRYFAGLRNLFSLYLPLADVWDIHDNTSRIGPRLIAEGRAGLAEVVHDVGLWTTIRETARHASGTP